MWGIIATWSMASDGVIEGSKILNKNGLISDAIEIAIRTVEDEKKYNSVGYGGLPNINMEVELDAAYMDGDNFNIGAVCSVKDVANPISVAKKLSENHVNQILCSEGAKIFARRNGFELKNMITDEAITQYKVNIEKFKPELDAYDGHDTVGMVGFDITSKIVAATSTSGVFLKQAGRIGDSPLVGSGFYADSEVGGATATGLGEDIMRGCISYEVVRLMKEGFSPQEATDKAVFSLDKRLKNSGRKKVGQISVVAMNKFGEWGASSNKEKFSFVVSKYNEPIKIYETYNSKNKTLSRLLKEIK